MNIKRSEEDFDDKIWRTYVEKVKYIIEHNGFDDLKQTVVQNYQVDSEEAVRRIMNWKNGYVRYNLVNYYDTIDEVFKYFDSSSSDVGQQ